MPRGRDNVIRNLNRAIRGIKGRTRVGIRLAAVMIKSESQKRSPVDTGAMKASHYVNMENDSGDFPVARIGATAHYSLIQHEDLSFFHPTGEAKFLENAFKFKAREAIAIIVRLARVK